MKKDQRQKKKPSPRDVLSKVKQLLKRALPGNDQAGLPAQWALIPVIRNQKQLKN
ncbi:MAG: hypothetical protein U0T56_00955 [Ferruginibacter sp.]|jgi:hypothetical protein